MAKVGSFADSSGASTLIAQGHFGYTFLHQKQNKSLGNKGQNCPFLGFQSRQSSKANKIDL